MRYGTSHGLMHCNYVTTQEGHMTTESIFVLTLIILSFGSVTAALALAEYCSIYVDNRLGWRYLAK